MKFTPLVTTLDRWRAEMLLATDGQSDSVQAAMAVKLAVAFEVVAERKAGRARLPASHRRGRAYNRGLRLLRRVAPTRDSAKAAGRFLGEGGPRFFWEAGVRDEGEIGRIAGERIRQRRLALGLTQRELAEAI